LIFISLYTSKYDLILRVTRFSIRN